MKSLQRRVRREEEIYAAAEARRRKCKMPNSLTMKQEESAKERFEANRLKKPVTDSEREIIQILNIDSNGQLNPSLYTQYKKRLQEEMKRIKTQKPPRPNTARP